ncbi:MAG: hypothetical protein U9R29_09840 [Thermodesulfobacteriota bacterium]|nr:hypothetical protein [Thermodesulfobacteriota bacterium]
MISLVPTPDVLSMSRVYFDIFLLLTFPLHLILMNAMIGTTAIALWSHWRKDPVCERLAYQLAKTLPLLIALTINFGVAPLLFAQTLFGHYLYSSSVIIGVFWLGIIPVLLLVYFGAYLYDFKFWSLGRRGIPVLLLSGVLMLCIGFVFSSNMTLMLDPEAWTAYFNHSGGAFLNLSEATLIPRYTHMMIGACAVGGLAVACLSRLWQRNDADVAALGLTVGMRLFFAATCVQLVAGIWFLLSLPADILLLFMGRNMLASSVFIIALIVVVLVLRAAWNKRLGGSVWLTLSLIYLMSFMRAFVREGYLGKNFVTQLVTTNQDFSPLILFVVSLVIGLAMIAWMIKAAFNAQEGQ